jgi:hypothetical protein
MRSINQLFLSNKDKTAQFAIQRCIKLIDRKVFVSYPFIIAIMAVLQVMTVIYDDKNFLFFGLNISVGWLVCLPIMLYLFQIVSEVYGWQYARQILWCNFTVNLLMTLIIVAFKYVPFSALNREDIKTAFILLMDNDKLFDMLPMMFSILLSDFITSALMSWSKFYWNGRHVFIRILILHLASEIIIVLGGFIAYPLSGYPLSEAWVFARDAFIARTIVMIILLPIARMVIWWLQNRVEGVVVFDYRRDFKVFSFTVNHETVLQFDAKEWNELSDLSKQQFNFERAVLLYHSTHGSSMRVF